MARQKAPKVLGVLKSNSKAQKNWEITVSELDGGVIRLQGRKRAPGLNEWQVSEKFTQMKLVDVDGNEV